jgi:Ca2+-transporting ATPase
MPIDTPTPIPDPHSLPAREVARALACDPEKGLDSREAQSRLERFGKNEIPGKKPRSRVRMFLDQFADPVIYILGAAAVLAYVFKDAWEGTAIAVVIGISVSIGYLMERQAYRTLESLRKLGQSHTRVMRSGTLMQIHSFALVPGDLVVLSPGDVVPADLRILTAEQLSLKESALTGESAPTWKQAGVLPAETPLTGRSNMLYKGTVVATGSGTGLAVATAGATELGKIQQMALGASPPKTPLEKKLRALSVHLIWATLVVSVLIAAIGYFRGAGIVQMIETAVALAVATIPEGLPIVATIALARGMSRLARRQVIVKNLEAIQTLGATDIILTDKTGTLTEDSLRVSSLCYGAGQVALEVDSDQLPQDADSTDPVLRELLRTAVLCNNAGGSGLVQGDSLESALLDFARASGMDVEQTREAFPELSEVPFDARRKLMATAHRSGEGYTVYAKGAFETLSGLTPSILGPAGPVPFEGKEAWKELTSDMAARGLRTLAFAYRPHAELPDPEALLDDLVFLGVIGFLDPPRKDVKPVFEIYRNAGIRVVMATGDHPETARRIALDTGLLEEDRGPGIVGAGNAPPPGSSLNGTLVYARVLPEGKMDLVSGFQGEGHIVGMIGDGINDVPALKKADIGIAMGIRGTEAAREAADVILKNDSFNAIELAIRQGRVVFYNIRQFTVYLLSCNLAEVLAVAVAAMGNLPAPLLPMQILFLNLVTDVFPALALGLGTGPPDIMRRPPENPRAPILNKGDWSDIIAYGLGISASVLGVVLYGEFVLALPASLINNLAFYTLMAGQLFHVFNMTAPKTSFFRNEVVSNPYVWGAIVLSLGLIAMAYAIPVVSEVLRLERIDTRSLLLPLAFALGSVVLIRGFRALASKLRSR